MYNILSCHLLYCVYVPGMPFFCCSKRSHPNLCRRHELRQLLLMHPFGGAKADQFRKNFFLVQPSITTRKTAVKIRGDEFRVSELILPTAGRIAVRTPTSDVCTYLILEINLDERSF